MTVTDKPMGMEKVCIGIALAAVLWFVMFAPWLAPTRPTALSAPVLP